MKTNRARGQSLVEFALVLPLFLVMLMAVIDVGRAIWAQNSVSAAAREGARFAIVHGGSDSTTCPVGPTSREVNTLPAASSTCPYPSPSKQSIVDAVVANATAGGSSLIVTVCYGLNCSGNADTNTNSRGQPVTVAVTSQVNLILPQLVGISGFGISSTSTMVVNH